MPIKAIVSKTGQIELDFGGFFVMTTRSVGKFLPALKLRLGTKAVISAILLIAVNTALVVGAAHWSLTNEFGDRALRDIEVNLRTLGLAFAETYSDAKITMKDGAVVRAEIPKMPEFKVAAVRVEPAGGRVATTDVRDFDLQDGAS